MNHIKRSLNCVTLIGCMDDDPQVKRTADGHAVLDTTLATTSVYKNGQERWERTILIPVVVYGTSAEYLGRNAAKGTRLLITGSIDNSVAKERRSAQDNSIVVVAEHIQIMSSFKLETGTGYAEKTL